MKISDVVRLLKKHFLLLILVPAILGTLVAYMITDVYTSSTTLYTGMTSGTNVQVDQSFNLYTSNASFDNLMNIIQSRETTREVALRLLAIHLMMDRSDPKYISTKSLTELKKMVPAKVRGLVVRKLTTVKNLRLVTSVPDPEDTSFSFSNDKGRVFILPASIDADNYRQTVKNLAAYMSKDDTNFIYRLLNGGNPHYSIKAISSVDVKRINSSDLIEMTYNSDDPGICQQTLQLLTGICMKNYIDIKESRTDKVVQYYEIKVRQAADRLSNAEDELMRFNEVHKVVNFEDQSRSAAGAQGALSTELQNRRIKLAGSAAALKQVEDKLLSQKKVQQKSGDLIQKRNELADINARLSTAEITGAGDSTIVQSLKSRSAQLKDQIGDAVSELYSSGATIEGVPASSLLDVYNQNVKDFEENKTAISMLQSRLTSSENSFSSYAPAGIELKRIQREITVAEQEYLELLHGLNATRLKVQDVALSSNIRAVDPPYFPVSPDAKKKMVMITLAVVFGLLLVLSLIFMLEYFDATLRNPEKAARILKLEPVGVFPKLKEQKKAVALPFITNRLLEMIIQQIELFPKGMKNYDQPKTILFFSMVDKEGKTTLVGNIARKLKEQGKKVVVINFSSDSMIEARMTRESPKGKGQSIELPVFNHSSSVMPEMMLAEVVPGESERPEEISTIGIPGSNNNIEEHFIYQVDESYYSITHYQELLEKNNFDPSFVPDYILIELPPVLYHPYPAGLVESSDVSVMVCRANRSWTQADKGALNTFMKIAHHDPLFLLNGVESQVVRSALGNISRKTRKVRRKMKKAAV